jgi:hypothetical protein
MGTWSEEQLTEAVERAFRQTHEGRSTDDVVICDRLNGGFVRAAQAIVAGADAALLNWTLLGLRKSSSLGPVTTEGQRVRGEEECIRAADSAARAMQERHKLSLDRVLCDPVLRQEFDLVAQTAAPGFSPYQYRKAALYLRKAGRR